MKNNPNHPTLTENPKETTKKNHRRSEDSSLNGNTTRHKSTERDEKERKKQNNQNHDYNSNMNRTNIEERDEEIDNPHFRKTKDTNIENEENESF